MFYLFLLFIYYGLLPCLHSTKDSIRFVQRSHVTMKTLKNKKNIENKYLISLFSRLGEEVILL